MNAIRPWLYIGKYRDTQRSIAPGTSSNWRMLQLAEPVEQPAIASLYLPVKDGELLPPSLLRQGVLIACGVGIRRSPRLRSQSSKKRKALTF